MTEKELLTKNIGLISLGCDKNRVDSEHILYNLQKFGFKITPDPNRAEILIVNTCAFIEPARKESIDTILEMAEYKKTGCEKLIVVGCLPQKFYDEVCSTLPEVDLFLGVKSEDEIVKAICSLYNVKCSNIKSDEVFSRVLTTPKHYAYLKIAEGCSNSCTYCLIPKIRGGYVSVPIEKLVSEATELSRRGVTELIIVAQDVTKYGIDLYKKLMLVPLLKELSKIEGIRWIRLHYCYPELLSDELIDEIASNPKIAKYIELPLQHADDKILKLMKRASTRENAAKIIQKLKAKIPDIAIRTSFILGFPSETETEFENLKNFIIEQNFDHIGFFAYSAEKDTEASTFINKVPKSVANKRVKSLALLQAKIVEQNHIKKVGSTVLAVCEEQLDTNLYAFRSQYNSPNVDTYIFVYSDDFIKVGTYRNIKITDVTNKFDLIGEILWTHLINCQF